MSGFAVYVQEGFGVEGHSVYFTNEAPTYEAEQIPVVCVTTSGEKIPAGTREETFVIFSPLNGPMRQRGKANRIPFQRLLAVVEQTDNSREAGDEDV